MTNPMTEVIVNSIVIGSAILSVIFTIGIVWRVEKELDKSYKLFALAIIAFTASEVLEIFRFEGRVFVALAILLLKLLFAICFLAGIIIMRDILRRMDGEKNPPSLPDEKFFEHNRSI